MIIGARVRWKHLDDKGKPVVPIDGFVVNFERASSSAWAALILQDDGTFQTAAAADLVVVRMPSTSLLSEASCVGDLGGTDPAPAEIGPPNPEPYWVDVFEDYLDAKFPGLETYGGGPIERIKAMLDSVANLIDCVSTEVPGFERVEGEQPGDHAARLIRELKNELLTTGEGKARAEIALAPAVETIARLEKDLAAARKKSKPRGPAGPGEDKPPEESK